MLTAALSEPSLPLPAVPRTAARRDGTSWIVSGVKVNVPHAATAQRMLVSAMLDDEPGVLVVDPAEPEVSISDSSVRFEKARGEELVGAADALRRYALAGACALVDGVLAGALDLTVRHVGTRHQFGKPLSTFQAVACQVADVYIAARTLHLATISACWSLDPDDLDIAAYWLAAEALPAVHTCHHLHGGLGLDITYPMHRFYGMAKELTRFVGGTDHRLGEIDVH